MKIAVRNILDDPRVVENNISIVCLEKLRSYIINGAEQKYGDIFEIVNYIVDKIKNLDHDDTMAINLTSRLHYEDSEEDMESVLSKIK